jgi:hypothetical protein
MADIRKPILYFRHQVQEITGDKSVSSLATSSLTDTRVRGLTMHQAGLHFDSVFYVDIPVSCLFIFTSTLKFSF